MFSLRYFSGVIKTGDKLFVVLQLLKSRRVPWSGSARQRDTSPGSCGWLSAAKKCKSCRLQECELPWSTVSTRPWCPTLFGGVPASWCLTEALVLWVSLICTFLQFGGFWKISWDAWAQEGLWGCRLFWYHISLVGCQNLWGQGNRRVFHLLAAQYCGVCWPSIWQSQALGRDLKHIPISQCPLCLRDLRCWALCCHPCATLAFNSCLLSGPCLGRSQ